MVLIYRIQDKDALGLYNDSSRWRDYGFEPEDYSRHPLPGEDSKLVSNGYDNFCYRYSRSAVFFGFVSVEQLKAWLYKDRWRQRLTDLGYLVYVFEVDDELACLGDTQAVFIRDKATLKETISLLEI